jgi:hypothetical protein
MASITSNPIVERFRRRYELSMLISGLRIADVAYFQRKIQLFGFSAFRWLAVPIKPDMWNSTVLGLVTIRQAVLYLKMGHTYTHTLQHSVM